MTLHENLARIGLPTLVPPFISRVLIVGDVDESIRLHCDAIGAHVWTLQGNKVAITNELIERGGDRIVLGGVFSIPAMACAMIEQVHMVLDPNGEICLLFPDWHTLPDDWSLWDTALERYGLLRYHTGLLQLKGTVSPFVVLTAVRRHYNPIHHAREMGRKGHPDHALAILRSIPEALSDDTRLVAQLEREKKRYAVAAPGVPLNNDRNPLHLGLVKGDHYGWGVCSRYLIQEISAIRPVHVLNLEAESSEYGHLAGPLFQALVNVDFDPMFSGARGTTNYGYTFFENELSDRSVENARRYDCVLAGSSWCRDRMHEKGIENSGLLIQGIDPDIFYPLETPAEPDSGRFTIFSGGKFELRKGQDLVLRAVKIMQDKYPDVWLINCWFNLWPESLRLMRYSRHIRFEYQDGEPWQRTMQRTYAMNGLDERRIITCELIPQSQQRELFARTDIGLFPNRCEGGTNLVLMEYMACARPVIASYTSGHKDILNAHNALLLNRMAGYHVRDAKDVLIGRWQEASLDEMVALLEHAYHNRSALHPYGVQAGHDLKRFTWNASARQLLGIIGD